MNKNNNPMPSLLDALSRRAVNSDSESLPFDAEKANRAMSVASELMDVFERRGIDPIEAYTITGALSDSIYLHLISLASKVR